MDPRLDKSEKDKFLAFLAGASDEELDEWFAMLVMMRVDSLGELMGPEWQQAIFMWSWQVIGTSAQSEFQHGRGHTRTHARQNWASFCADSFNGECQLRLEWQHKLALWLQKSTVGGTGPHAESLPPAPKRVRKKLAKDVFRTEYISARKAAGLKSYVTSDEFRKEFDEAWKKEEANPVSLERLEGEAGQSISAKVAKAKAKTAAKAKAALTCPSVASSSTAIVVREKPNLTDLTGMHSSETMERVSTATYTHASPLVGHKQCPLRISEENLNKVLSLTGRRRSLASASTEFATMVTRPAMNRHPVEVELPKPVVWHPTAPGMGDFRARLISALQKSCRTCLSPSPISSVHSRRLCFNL